MIPPPAESEEEGLQWLAATSKGSVIICTKGGSSGGSNIDQKVLLCSSTS